MRWRVSFHNANSSQEAFTSVASCLIGLLHPSGKKPRQPGGSLLPVVRTTAMKKQRIHNEFVKLIESDLGAGTSFFLRRHMKTKRRLYLAFQSNAWVSAGCANLGAKSRRTGPMDKVINFLNDACAYYDRVIKWQPAKENEIATYDKPTQDAQRRICCFIMYIPALHSRDK